MNGQRTPSGKVLRKLHEVLFRPSAAELVVPAEVKVMGWKKDEPQGVVIKGAGGPGAGGNNPGGGTVRIGGRVPWGAEVEFAYRAGYDSRGQVSVAHIVDERGYGVMLAKPEAGADSSPSEKHHWWSDCRYDGWDVECTERPMSKSFRPYNPEQQLLLPAALQEWLPEDHLAYFISDVVDQLDLSAIAARYQGEERGGPPYHPRMMVKVLLYGYCTGVASSRRIAQRLHEDIAFRVLAANNTPDFRTISDFRKDHLAALAELFHQVLELCREAGLVKLGHVALDITKVRANSSKHKAMSYGRMKEKEAQLASEVAELLRRAEEVDEEEDRRYGRDKRGDELPEELSFREGRLRKIREAKAA